MPKHYPNTRSIFWSVALLTLLILWSACDDEPSTCSSDEDCREGFVCDQTIYKGECIQAVQVIRCGDRLCQYPPEICVRDTCVVMDPNRDMTLPLEVEVRDEGTPLGDQGSNAQLDAQAMDMGTDLLPPQDMRPALDQTLPLDASPPQDLGPTIRDQGGQACTSACDCTPGLACQSGQCTPLNEPVYCCSGNFCPPEASCETLEGRLDICSALDCTSACDCNPGMRCEGGNCVFSETPLFCCNSGPCPAGADCETPSQRQLRCETNSCVSACDCAAGLSCDNGTCISASPPVFCCTEGLCPAGQICENPAGQRATCESDTSCNSACDCLPGRSCLGGACTLGNEPIYCCDDAANCPIDAVCQPSIGGRFELCQ